MHLVRWVATAITLAVLLPSSGSFASAETNDGGSSTQAPKVEGKGGGSFEGSATITLGRRHAKEQKHAKSTRGLAGHAPPKPHKLSKRELAAIEAMCREAPGGVCDDSGPKATPKSKLSPAKLVGGLNQLARTLIVRLQLPDPTPRFGPDPSVNEWKMAAVGYPLWLWTDGPTVVSSRVRAYGITFTLRADWQSTTFDMGDGHQVTCSRTLVYPSTTKPGRKSPACGYTYLTSSLPRGNYMVTATTHWRISWRALGQSGSLPGTHSGQWSLPVGELNALVVK